MHVAFRCGFQASEPVMRGPYFTMKLQQWSGRNARREVRVDVTAGVAGVESQDVKSLCSAVPSVRPISGAGRGPEPEPRHLAALKRTSTQHHSNFGGTMDGLALAPTEKLKRGGIY